MTQKTGNKKAPRWTLFLYSFRKSGTLATLYEFCAKAAQKKETPGDLLAWRQGSIERTGNPFLRV